MPKQEKVDEYEEIEDADFFRFEKIGDCVSGKLIDVGTSEKYKIGLYTLEKEDGSSVRFHGSADIDGKMKSVKMGESIKVEFYDLEKRGKGNMKLFRLMRKK